MTVGVGGDVVLRWPLLGDDWHCLALLHVVGKGSLEYTGQKDTAIDFFLMCGKGNLMCGSSSLHAQRLMNASATSSLAEVGLQRIGMVTVATSVIVHASE